MKFFLPISIIAVIIAFFLGKDYGYKSCEVKYQNLEIKTNNETNKIIEESVERRKNNSLISIDDVWDKLFERYCSDCAKH